MPAILEEDRRDYCRRRAPVLPEGATVGGAWEGEHWCDRRGDRSQFEFSFIHQFCSRVRLITILPVRYK